jgi:hypothetical protein
MNKRQLAPPSPEVQYLPAVFRRIETGEIRVPAFQRRFVWSEAQVLALLESVYKGYPIGSVLFWKVQEAKLQIERDELLPFPDVEERYPISFVLDGMQRLSSLYGVFHWKTPDEPNVFNVVFDLRNERFTHYDPYDNPEAHISLSSLFSPRQLLETQKGLASMSDGDSLIDRTIKLHSTFQEYLIPTVTITERDVPEVVEIFERVNSTGTVLSAVDFMRALTWSSDFDLSVEISGLRDAFSRSNFELEPETLVKAVSIILGKAPTPRDMLLLRNFNAQELHQGIDRTRAVLQRVIEFLKSDFKILSSDFVPYEAQLLVLTKLFQLTPMPSTEILSAVRVWFWSIGLSEGFRGKPDSYVVKALNDIEKLVNGNAGSLTYRLDLDPKDFMERRFIKGKALSQALASMFAIHDVHSLVTGVVIEPELFMREFAAENFQSLYPIEIIRSVLGESTQSARVFANIVVIREAEKKAHLSERPEELIAFLYDEYGAEHAQSILESQFITPDATKAIIENDPESFLTLRADALFAFAHYLCSQ